MCSAIFLVWLCFDSCGHSYSTRYMSLCMFTWLRITFFFCWLLILPNGLHFKFLKSAQSRRKICTCSVFTSVCYSCSHEYGGINFRLFLYRHCVCSFVALQCFCLNFTWFEYSICVVYGGHCNGFFSMFASDRTTKHMALESWPIVRAPESVLWLFAFSYFYFFFIWSYLCTWPIPSSHSTDP